MSAAQQRRDSDRGSLVQAAQWYLRSGADRDTHRGRLFGNGTVMADCGLTFRPRPLAYGAKALPGYPPDPDQVCPKCERSAVPR
ncbi:MAG: hypothetical protein ACRDRG_21585 [Pseudonocardiaceae bacterium]